MDPNANLEEQLQLARQIIDSDADTHSDHFRLAELVLGLHAWLHNQGFLPKAWSVGMLSQGKKNKLVEALFELKTALIAAECCATQNAMTNEKAKDVFTSLLSIVIALNAEVFDRES